MNGNHIVAWRHIIFTSVGHLLLGNNTIDLWKMRKSSSLRICKTAPESSCLGKPSIKQSKDSPYFWDYIGNARQLPQDVHYIFCIHKLKYLCETNYFFYNCFIPLYIKTKKKKLVDSVYLLRIRSYAINSLSSFLRLWGDCVRAGQLWNCRGEIWSPKKSQHKWESAGEAQKFNLTRCQVHTCTESLAQFPGIS